MFSFSSVQSPSLVAQVVKRLPTMRKTWFNPWVRKISWRRKWRPTPVFLPEKSHGQRSLVGYSPKGYRESDTCILGINPLSNVWFGNIYQQSHLFLSFSLLDVFDCPLYLLHLPGGYILLSLCVFLCLI